jgi:hypothetical protein
MFERAAQVNARFTASSCRPEEIVAALETLGLARRQITVLTPQAAPAPPPPGWGARLRGAIGRPDATPPPPAAREIQITVHLGQDAALSEAAQAVFRQFGATGIEQFGPTSTPNRAFGPGGQPPTGGEPDQDAG